MFFYIVLVAWIGGVVISFANGNRRLPSITLLLGLVAVISILAGKERYFRLAALALLTGIIWIANKADTT